MPAWKALAESPLANQYSPARTDTPDGAYLHEKREFLNEPRSPLV